MKRLYFWCISYLVAAVSLQSLWSLALAVVDIYALLVKRSLRNTSVVSLFAIGDGVSYSRVTHYNRITYCYAASNIKALLMDFCPYCLNIVHYFPFIYIFMH